MPLLVALGRLAWIEVIPHRTICGFGWAEIRKDVSEG